MSTTGAWLPPQAQTLEFTPAVLVTRTVEASYRWTDCHHLQSGFFCASVVTVCHAGPLRCSGFHVEANPWLLQKRGLGAIH